VGNYKVYISDDLRKLTKAIAHPDFSEIAILVDENTRACCLPLLLRAAPALKNALILEIPAGENFKTIDTCSRLWEELLNRHVDRNALLINLGGGVIGDMGGFVASTYKRGIAFINIPTTLLAQVDATIGGKLGVDFGSVKNAIGLFANPVSVLVHHGFLKTLPDAEVFSGFAEMIKHSLISSVQHWKNVKKLNPLKTNNWEMHIHDSLLVKKKIVQQDPLEKNVRKVLNFGHTFGHAFESAALQKGTPLLHGHAVALGLIAESFLSNKLTGLKAGELEEITTFIMQYYGSYFSNISKINWQKWIKHDKKNANGKFNFTLLKSIGKPVINVDCEEKLLHQSVDYLKRHL